MFKKIKKWWNYTPRQIVRVEKRVVWNATLIEGNRKKVFPITEIIETREVI